MMTNLFSVFDPATPSFMSANWLILLTLLISYYSTFTNPFYKTNMKTQPASTLLHSLGEGFTSLFKTAPYVAWVGVGYFTNIIILNWMSLAPFVFTATAQLSITMTLSLPIWVAANIYGWSMNTNNLLAHQIPQSTPWLLMPVMVMIEMISNLIRPITLTVRLTANLLAGHILLSILMSATLMIAPITLPFIAPIQYCLIILEIVVGFIQAYVFATLVIIYASEMAS